MQSLSLQEKKRVVSQNQQTGVFALSYKLVEFYNDLKEDLRDQWSWVVLLYCSLILM